MGKGTHSTGIHRSFHGWEEVNTISGVDRNFHGRKRVRTLLTYTGVFMEGKGYVLSWRRQEFSWKEKGTHSPDVDRPGYSKMF